MMTWAKVVLREKGRKGCEVVNEVLLDLGTSVRVGGVPDDQ